MRFMLCLNLLLIPLAQADLFHASEASEASENSESAHQQTITDDLAKNSQNSTACFSQGLELDLNKLRLIGLVQIGEEFRALFQAENLSLIELKVGDYLSLSRSQITDISLKSIHYIPYSKQCEPLPQSLLKL